MGEIGELRDTWTSVNGNRIFARVSTRRVPRELPPVVLVHGYLVSGRYFTPLAERLATDFAVYVPDLPGIGESRGSVTPSVPCLAAALVEWLDAVRMPPPVLVGNSMGCQIIAHVAATQPDRVNRVALISPTVDPAHRSVRQQFLRLMAAVPHERLNLLPVVLRDYIRARPSYWSEMTRYMLDDRIEEKLPRLRAPTLVLRGEFDPICTQAWAERVARLTPSARLIVIPGAGHVPNWSAPRQVARALRPFIRAGAAQPGVGPRSRRAERTYGSSRPR